jgi:hypothetical protein
MLQLGKPHPKILMAWMLEQEVLNQLLRYDDVSVLPTHFADACGGMIHDV